MKIGKHGGQRPTLTILGNPVEQHFHKRGIGNGYYVVVENYPIENEAKLILELQNEVKKLIKISKTETPTTIVGKVKRNDES